MPYTDEPKGLAFINNLNMATFGPLCTQLLWVIGSLTLTKADYDLLHGATELHRQSGIFLAGILVGSWTGKTVAGVVESNNKRKASPEYATVLEAKERGRVAGAAAAAVIANTAADNKQTREHPVPRPSRATTSIPEEPTS